MDTGLMKKWEASASRYDELTSQLMDASVISQPALLVKLTKERTELETVSHLFHRYQEILKQRDETAHMLADPSAGAELHSLATEETAQLRAERDDLERQVLEHLTPKDPRDEKNLFLEIRAGTGGDEAALFAGDLFRMYAKFADQHKLKVDIVEASETGKGGYKTLIAVIEGKGGYGLFKYESGVHRVQRVPVTEAAGRIHTATVTVAVMPEVDEVDVQIDPQDLRIDTFCSSGAGGQSVNTTYSAVRITHLPTGVVVSMQDEKSQIKNREKAMRVLRARLQELEEQKQHDAQASERKSMVGSGDRSEKIRTYNFKENRVTDHRIGMTVHQLDLVMEGQLDEFVDALRTHYQTEKLKAESVAA